LKNRYGDTRQHAVLRYEPKKYWTELLVKPKNGRSDFQIVSDLPSTFAAKLKIFSRLTKMYQKEENLVFDNSVMEWKKYLNTYVEGMKTVVITPEARNPWLQVYIGQEVPVLEVCYINMYPRVYIEELNQVKNIYACSLSAAGPSVT